MKFNRKPFVVLILVWMATIDMTILAQQGPGPGQAPQQLPAIQPPTLGQQVMGGLTNTGKDYRISPGDVIQIRVEDGPELSHNYQVTSAGNIEMPVLGQVLVRNKTTYELAQLIESSLRDQEYLKSPNVMVTLVQLNSRAFFIQGSVLKPGLYQLEGRPSLLTLISLAGGLSETHGPTIIILRPSKTLAAASENSESKTNPEIQTPLPLNDLPTQKASDYELIKVNIGALYNGQLDQNQKLEPGDIVNVPTAGVFFVAGEVKLPGSFPLKDGTTLRQAISLAQGITYKSKPSQGLIFREDTVTGSRQEIKVNISAVMKGRAADILIRANDIIVIPNSRSKAVGGALLTGFGLGAFRFPIP